MLVSAHVLVIGDVPVSRRLQPYDPTVMCVLCLGVVLVFVF